MHTKYNSISFYYIMYALKYISVFIAAVGGNISWEKGITQKLGTNQKPFHVCLLIMGFIFVYDIL